MNFSIKICEATSEDARGIVLVRRATWLTTYPNEEYGITRKDIEDKINKRTIEEDTERMKTTISTTLAARTWVAKDGTEIVGFIVVIKGQEKNQIGALYILDAYQGKGIGTQLMNKAMEWLGTDKDIQFEVATYNTSAIAFYKKFGFVENGVGNNPVGNLPSGKSIPEIEMIKRF